MDRVTASPSRRDGNAWLDMLRPDLHRLLESLHEGVFEQPYWSSFLSAVREWSGADYVSLVFRRADARARDVNLLASGEGREPSNSAQVDEILSSANQIYRELEADRPHRLQEIVKPGSGVLQDYVKYLSDRGINYAIAIRVEPGAGAAWMTLSRSDSDFTAEVAEVMAVLAPHLKIAARTLAAIENERIRADIVSDAVHRLNFGWVTFDAWARVVEIDPAAERLLTTTPEVGAVTPGRAFPVKDAAQRALLEALSAFAEAPNLTPRAIHLVDEPWLDMLTVPIRYRAVSGGVTPVAVGYVHGVGAASSDRCEQLKQLFSLTNSEARLALALTQGKRIAEAAKDLKLTIETARNYTKRIYAKTDTRGQADLVRVILASVIALS